MKDGSIYKGYYINGEMGGYGEYIWADNSIYKGIWKNNQFNGFGEYTWCDKFYKGKISVGSITDLKISLCYDCWPGYQGSDFTRSIYWIVVLCETGF